MKVLSESEIRESFASFGQFGYDRLQSDEKGPFFAHPEADCIVLEYPTKLEQFPFFAATLARLAYDESDFEGARLWFTEWGVWNERDEGVGCQIVETMNRAAGQPMSFEAGPGHQFRADEFTSAVGMLMQPMLFGWDAYYLPVWSFGVEEYFLHVSHDSAVDVITRSKEFHTKAFTILQELDLNPQKAADGLRGRFCRASEHIRQSSEAARRLAALGGTMPDLQPISRRRPDLDPDPDASAKRR
jgi:hypothetical protein